MSDIHGSGAAADTERFPTGIAGLDTIIGGGVFKGGIYIVQGAPGAGKTILGNQICFGHVAAGGRALYVTLLAESHSRMMSHMRRLSFFDETVIPDRLSFLGAFKVLEEQGLRGLLDVVRREVRSREASVVVLDGLITVNEKAGSDLELKKFVHELQTQAVFTGCTMFLLTSAVEEGQKFPPEHTMVDGLIELETFLHGRRAERELRVRKLRGSGFHGGNHSFRITEDGIRVFPRIEAILAEPSRPDRADGEPVSTGIAGLDAMLGGGPARHSVTLLLGPAGSGKTTAGMQFLGAAAAGDPVLLFSFNENPAAIAVKARSLKLPLAGRLETGNAEVIWQPGTEAVLDQTCATLLEAVARRKVRRLLIDGLDGFQKLTEEKSRVGMVMAALCNELRGRGVTTMATAETDLAGIIPGQALAGLTLTGLSPIAENLVVFRFAAVRSEIHRLAMVLKARDTETDLRLRSFDIRQGGIVIETDFKAADAILRELGQGPQLPRADRSLTGD